MPATTRWSTHAIRILGPIHPTPSPIITDRYMCPSRHRAVLLGIRCSEKYSARWRNVSPESPGSLAAMRRHLSTSRPCCSSNTITNLVVRSQYGTPADGRTGRRHCKRKKEAGPRTSRPQLFHRQLRKSYFSVCTEIDFETICSSDAAPAIAIIIARNFESGLIVYSITTIRPLHIDVHQRHSSNSHMSRRKPG